MENNEVKEKSQEILSKLGVLTKEYMETKTKLEQELIDIFPVKKDEKVEIWQKNGQGEADTMNRHAFVTKVRVWYSQRDQKADIICDLQKCKNNGEKGQHSDMLRYGEYIKKI